MKRIALVLLSMFCLALPASAQTEDKPDCKDHPLFTRMPDYWISGCKQKEFDARVFSLGQGRKVEVEGQTWEIVYRPQSSLKVKPSELQILRNFEEAVRKLEGTVVSKEKGKETFQITKEGKEVWVEVHADFTGGYRLFIVEKKGMTQDIVANAGAFSNDLKTTGHVAVYGIYFAQGSPRLSLNRVRPSVRSPNC